MRTKVSNFGVALGAGVVAVAFAFGPAATSAIAQLGGRGGQNAGNQDGLFELPGNVRRIVSVDAQNVLIVESRDPRDNSATYDVLPVRHVYSGGIAKLFGGTIIPTEQFVSPGFGNGAGGIDQGTGGRGGLGNVGGAGSFGSGIGGQDFGGQGFGNQGFGGQNFGNQGFGNQGFGGNVGNFRMAPNFQNNVQRGR